MQAVSETNYGVMPFSYYTTYRFFTLYCMLHNRGDMRLKRLGFWPVKTVLDYVKYKEARDKILNMETLVYEDRVSDNYDEMCKTLTGIKLTFVNDPVNVLGMCFFDKCVNKHEITNDNRKIMSMAEFLSLQTGPLLVRDIWIYDIAVVNGQFECLMYIKQMGYAWSANTTANAVSGGKLEMLKFLHERGCPWDHNVCEIAAMYKHFDCFKYAIENGCPCDMNTSPYVAEAGRLDLLKILHENGHKFLWSTGSYAAENGHFDCVKYLCEIKNPKVPYFSRGAIKANRLDILEYVVNNGCPLDIHAFLSAAGCGSFAIIKYLREHKCPWNEDVCAEAANNLEILRYLRSPMCCICYTCNYSGNNSEYCECGGTYGEVCPWNEEVYWLAMVRGDMECFEYARLNGCPWSEELCARAARSNDHGFLRHLHACGCPWDETTCLRAIESGGSECFKYAIENGCPHDGEKLCLAASRYNHPVFKYLIESGYKCDRDAILASFLIQEDIDEIKEIFDNNP